MKNNKRKSSCLILCLIFVLLMSAGCQTQKSTKTDAENINQTFDEITFPLEETKTLTYWGSLHAVVAATATDLGKTELYQELEKRTGVKIEFRHPPQGQEADQFNLMIASGDYPDIIEYSWLKFPGGPEKAIEEDYIIPLNQFVERESSNLHKVLEQNEEWNKMVRTDNGNYYVYPFLRGDELLTVYAGPIIRKDWLDQLQKELPETIDEWYDALKAFKEVKGADSPLTYQPNVFYPYKAFIGAYGISMEFYQTDGKIQYGPIQPEYKEFLKTFKKWYSEGLLDRDFATVDKVAVDAKITNGRAGAVLSSAGGGLGRFIEMMRDKDPEYNLVATAYPSLKKGEVPAFGQRDSVYTSGGSAAISSQCKDPALAAKWLDYAYGEEGHMLFNFGIVGESYELVDGEPKYTDLVFNNPDNLSVSNAMGRYMRSVYHGPFVQDLRYNLQYLNLKQQKDALQLWSKTDAAKHLLPSITPTWEESQRLAKIMNEVKTYVDEMFYKFIMNSESLDNFDSYVETVKAMGIEEAIKIQQEGLKRYNNR